MTARTKCTKSYVTSSVLTLLLARTIADLLLEDKRQSPYLYYKERLQPTGRWTLVSWLDLSLETTSGKLEESATIARPSEYEIVELTHTYSNIHRFIPVGQHAK